MTAQDEIRIDRVVVELEQLGKRIERGGSDPVERAGIFGLAHQEQQRQSEVGKELHPAVELQIPARAPQQQTEYSGCEQRPEQDGSQPCAHALLDDAPSAACAASLIRERRRSSSSGSDVSIRPEA